MRNRTVPRFLLLLVISLLVGCKVFSTKEQSNNIGKMNDDIYVHISAYQLFLKTKESKVIRSEDDLKRFTAESSKMNKENNDAMERYCKEQGVNEKQFRNYKTIITSQAQQNEEYRQRYKRLEERISKERDKWIINSKNNPKLKEHQVLNIALVAIEAVYPGESKINLPYVAKYDNGKWIVRGTMPPNIVGGTAVIEINDVNGTVAAIYHDE